MHRYLTWIESGQNGSSNEIAAASDALGVLIIAVECIRGMVLCGVWVEARPVLLNGAAVCTVTARPFHRVKQLVLRALLVRYAVVLVLSSCIRNNTTWS